MLQDSICKLLFNKNQDFKQYLKAFEELKESLVHDEDEFLEIIDLVIKWMFQALLNTKNSQLCLECFKFTQTIAELLKSKVSHSPF